jgi:hypothetical protein
MYRLLSWPVRQVITFEAGREGAGKESRYRLHYSWEKNLVAATSTKDPLVVFREVAS